MTQQEQTQQERLMASVGILLAAIAGLMIAAMMTGYAITAFDMIGLCIGALLAFPFIYLMRGK